MKSYTRISTAQYGIVLMFAYICLTPFGFPTLLYRHLGHHAWIMVVVAFVFSAANAYITFDLARKFPEENLVEWSQRLFGKLFGSLYSLAALIVIFLWGTLMFMELWTIINYTQLPSTPAFAPNLYLIGAIVYLLSKGIEAWARASQILALVLVPTIVAFTLPQLPNASFARLLPLTDISWSSFANTEVLAALFMFRASFFVFFIYPHLKETRSVYQWSILAMAIAAAVILFSVMVPTTIFGEKAVKELAFPFQEAAATVELRGLPIQKISFLAPVIWQIIIVYVLGTTFFCVSRGIQSLFGWRKEMRILVALGTATYLFSIISVPYATLSRIVVYWSLSGLIVFALIPTIIWAILKVFGEMRR